MIFKLDDTDFSSYVSGLKESYETLVSENSGRNAAGTMSIDIIAHKLKLSVTFKPLTPEQVADLMIIIKEYVMNVKWDGMADSTTSTDGKTMYISTPSIEWQMYGDLKITKSFSINFIEV